MGKFFGQIWRIFLEEVEMQPSNSNMKFDIILSEMMKQCYVVMIFLLNVGGGPLFPGSDDNDQLRRIVEASQRA